MKIISILGAGSFGYAFARLIAENSPLRKFYLYDNNPDYINSILENWEHPVFHSGKKLPRNVIPTHSPQEAVRDADLIILSIPSRFLRQAISSFKHFLTKEVIFLSLIKGLEYSTDMRISELLDDEIKTLKNPPSYQFCSFSGGMIANELVIGNPLCGDLACSNKQTAKTVARLLYNDHLRIHKTDDLAGVELAGALKNVIAIGAGIFDGLGFGESSKSAFISASAEQVITLALVLGGRKKTFQPGSQAWFGDLMTTCYGKTRNREFGELIGKGLSTEEAVKKMRSENKSIEGYVTTKVVYNLILKHNIDAPLLVNIYKVLYGQYNPKDFVIEFVKGW